MITVPARRVKQFGVEFYEAGLSAKDIDRLVKFEVLGYSGGPRSEEPKKKSRMSARSRVNWDMLEKRIGESEAAYQRPVIRRKAKTASAPPVSTAAAANTTNITTKKSARIANAAMPNSNRTGHPGFIRRGRE